MAPETISNVNLLVLRRIEREDKQYHGSYVTKREKDDPSWDSSHTPSAMWQRCPWRHGSGSLFFITVTARQRQMFSRDGHLCYAGRCPEPVRLEETSNLRLAPECIIISIEFISLCFLFRMYLVFNQIYGHLV
jgi:hypothetical protein